MKRLVIAIIFLMSFSGCQPNKLYLKPYLDEQGEVFIYVQPFPQEAGRLRFNLERISAVMSDGSEFPLNLSISEFKGADMTRQRLVASGQLAPGTYTALLFKVKSAFLKGEEGDNVLLVPEEPVKIDFLFSVNRKKALVIALSLKNSESVVNGFDFSPSFHIFLPDMPIALLKGFVSNHDSNNITVFDKRTGNVSAVIETGKGPGGIAIDQRLRRAYVVLSEDDSVEVIDVMSGDVINRINLNPGDASKELSLTPDGRLLLTANYGSDTVSMIDPVSLIEISRINVGNGPNSVLIDSAGKRAYIFNLRSNTISVIDISNKSVAATISTETGPLRGQFNKKGDRLYVFHEWSPYLTVIDPKSFSILKRAFVGTGLSSIKVDNNTDMLYVGRRNGMHVEVYDPFTLTRGDYISADGEVSCLAIDGEGNNLHILLPEKKELAVINLASKHVVFVIDVGDNPFWVTMMGER